MKNLSLAFIAPQSPADIRTTQFRAPIVDAIEAVRRDEFWRALETAARAELWSESGWWADYWRLRVVAWKR